MNALCHVAGAGQHVEDNWQGEGLRASLRASGRVAGQRASDGIERGAGHEHPPTGASRPPPRSTAKHGQSDSVSRMALQHEW